MQTRNLFSERTELLQTGIVWAVYFFVNVIFCIKYNPFEAIKPLYLLIFYPLIVIGIYKITTYIRIQQKNYFFLFLAFAVLVFALFLWHYINHWSALAFESENLKSGKFTYEIPSHLGGYESSFPVWQLFYFPFYLFGDTAYGQWFCLLIFFIMLFCWRTRINIGGIILLLALSPGFWWEIAVRSDLLCNMLLLFVFLTAQFYYFAYWDKHKLLAAAITGFFLCTKMLVAIPLFLYFFRKFFKYTTKEKIGFASVVFVCFFIPFLPFLFGEADILNHPEYNPLFLQSRQGSAPIVAVGCILLLGAAFVWKRMKDLYFLAGAFLFALVLTTGIRIGLKNGWDSIIFEDEFDKSYFNVCIPFFLFFIHEVKKRKFDYSNYHISY
ncbi:MAG: hypothetical protein FWF53_03915 [Candidatus Azobacteroides sp.]|nr:hypothetical protein [Candidatus Azobacteroides sp.]